MINGPAINGPASIFAEAGVAPAAGPGPRAAPATRRATPGLTRLTVPFRDVHAADLVWTLGGPDESSLHTDVHVIGGLRAEVRILGASHQIIVRPADGLEADRGTRVGVPRGEAEAGRDASEILCETVACREGTAGSLPSVEELDLPEGYRYEVRCDVHRYGADDFPAWVKALTVHAASQAAGTVGLFPEVPGAITAVVVEPLPATLNGLLWRTWHTYPGGAESEYGEVVATRTVVHRATPL